MARRRWVKGLALGGRMMCAIDGPPRRSGEGYAETTRDPELMALNA
jgi:hypothetical protein